MSFSNFKVGTRLGFGFAVLLLVIIVVGGVGLMRLSQLDHMIEHMTTEDWTKARLTMETEARNRDSAARFARLLMVDGESEIARTLKDKIKVNSEANGAALKQIEPLLSSAEEKTQFAEASAAREAYNASRAEVIKLSSDPKTRAQALELYNTVTADLMEPYIDSLQKLKALQQQEFDNASEESSAAYRSSRSVILSIIGGAVIFGIVLAMLLARSIVRPLSNAVSIAESIKDGRLDNSIDVSGSDETAKLLGTLDVMQSALRARDQKDAEPSTSAIVSSNTRNCEPAARPSTNGSSRPSGRRASTNGW